MTRRPSPAVRWNLKIATLFLFVGCAPASPIESFNSIAVALERGDFEAAFAGMTPDTARIVRGLVASDTSGAVFPRGSLGAGTRAVEVDHTLVAGGELTVVIVETTDVPPQRGLVLMRLLEGEWRLDLVATEPQWSRDWKLSGATEGGPPSWMESEPVRVD